MYAVDHYKKFSAFFFLKGESALNVWEAFMTICATTYAGYPDKLVHNQGLKLPSKEWKSFVKDSSIEVHPSGFKSHEAIEAGERYNACV